MVFSSITFIYYFLPILLFVYFLTPKKYHNLILLIFSLLFYFYGEPRYIIVLLLSCLINYLFGLIISKKHSKLLLITCVTLNVITLCYFKYSNFFITNLNNLFSISIPLLTIALPIGISFFTFQTMSYVIDVYNGKVEATNSIIKFSTYVCLFPQLVAGPIVRYCDISNELDNRNENFDLFGNGIKRFIIGLAKKVMLANVIGSMCNILLSEYSPTVATYILIAIGYTLQIYFDFSGYSDMAIGLGSMFGFHFPENFNYPLIAKSITDFWRRWHITLSSWLRDYIYIPLGGNRVSKPLWLRNLFVVWFVTGFWHGASWNFIFWGLYFAVILIIEKLFLQKFLTKHKILSHIYSIILVIISFVIFNTNNIADFIIFMKNMLGLNQLPFINHETLYYLKDYLFIIIIASIASTPLIKNISRKISSKYPKLLTYLEPLILIILLIISTSYLIDGTFNPFLYFRF